VLRTVLTFPVRKLANPRMHERTVFELVGSRSGICKAKVEPMLPAWFRNMLDQSVRSLRVDRQTTITSTANQH
jgi:hypothetical protein